MGTAGVSLGLTVGGIAGGAASALTAGGSSIIKDKKIKESCEEIQTYMQRFEEQEKVTTEIFRKYMTKVEQVALRSPQDETDSKMKALGLSSRGVLVATFGIDAVIPGLRIFGRTLLAAGSTTARVFGGVLAAVGVVFSTWDLIEGLRGITNPNDVSQELREFAEQYSEDTADLRKFVTKMKCIFTEDEEKFMQHE